MSESTLNTGARDELRLRVLRALEANPERGFVEADNFRRLGRKVAYLYLLTPKGVAEKTSLATAFLGRKLEEYEVLRQEIEALKGEVRSGDLYDSGKGD